MPSLEERACDILMTEEGLDFRATKDIDLVLIIEAVDANFGKKFWKYVKQAGYEHCNKSSGVPQFYHFSHSVSNQYPVMIELFTQKLDAIQLPEDAVLIPLPLDDISSLSAILLDNDKSPGSMLHLFVPVRMTAHIIIRGEINSQLLVTYSIVYCYFLTIKLAAPIRKGYVFKGWYRDKKYRKKITAIKKRQYLENNTLCKMETGCVHSYI